MKAKHGFLLALFASVVCSASLPFVQAQEQQPAAAEKLPVIIKRIQPSTVLVLTYDGKGKPIAQGSGFFVSRTGHIITNRHVLEGASRAEVKTAQGKIHPISHILAEDKEGDLVLACVDIPPGSVQPLKLSDSIPLVGQRIVLIGNPLGLKGTVSDGILSAIRDIPDFGKMIQLSVPLSFGSSGSPAVDMKGQVIGIAALVIFGGQDQDQSFVIPSQRAASLKPGKPKTIAEWQGPAVDERLVAAIRDYFRAMSRLSENDYKQALHFLEKAVEKNPQYAKAWLLIGYCKIKLQRYSEAITAYKQVARIKPDNATAHHHLGIAYGKLGRFTEEIVAYKQAIRIWPDYAEAYNSLGMSYGELGRYREEITAYKQAIRIWPDYAEAYNNLGVSYGELGRYREEIAACKQAIRINPDLAQAHYNLGLAYNKVECYSKAAEASKQAVRINPDYAEAYNNLGFAYKQMALYTEAIEACKQAICIKPDLAEAHRNLATVYDKLGRYREALDTLKQVVDIQPDDAIAYCDVGLMYAKLKGYTEAAEAYKKAIRIKPDDGDAHYKLGLIYLQLGDRGSALKEYGILKDLDKELANKLFNFIHE